MRYKNSFLLTVVITAFTTLTTIAGYAQAGAKITGTLRDSLSHGPIAFATMVLSDQQTNVHIAAGKTDSTGQIVFKNLPSSTFVLRITHVGYEDFVKKNIVMDPTNREINLGAITMTKSTTALLREVVVTASKQALKISNGKKIFSVNQSLVSKGGNAADLLRNVPTLQVDVDGHVSLRGSGNVKILIEGKAPMIGNGDIAQLLQSIPASAIETIEVIPNPPASYDADGEGVINIILKKNSRPGTNGSVTAGAGTRDNYNTDVSLNYQKGKISLYGNYSFKDGKTLERGFQNVTYLHPPDSVVYSNETFPSVTSNEIHFAKAGIDYSIIPKSILGISASFNARHLHQDQVIPVNEYAADNTLLESFTRDIAVNNDGKTYELDLDYSQRFRKLKEELTFNFAYASGSFTDNEKFTTQFNPVHGVQSSQADTPLISETRHHSVNYNIQADYVLPLGQSGQFSAGYRSQITLGKNDQHAYQLLNTGEAPLYAFTDFFTSNNQVNAVYADVSGKTGNLSYQAGARAEDSRLHATLTSYDASSVTFTIPVIVPVKGVYPSLLLSEKLKDSSELQFSFAMRLSKPSVRQLNSTIDFSDPSNYNEGNPGLKPERVTNFELDYIKTWNNMSATIGIYNNIISHALQIIETSPVNNEITTIPENLNSSVTTGLELIGRVDFRKGWNLTANANVFNRYNAAAPQYGISSSRGISWNANITANTTPLKRFSFQVHADYSAPNVFLQFRNRANFSMDAAAKYDFIGNRASLSCNAADLFNSRRRAFLSSSDDVLLNFQRHLESSRATLLFSYRFGADAGIKKPKKEKRIEDAS